MILAIEYLKESSSLQAKFQGGKFNLQKFSFCTGKFSKRFLYNFEMNEKYQQYIFTITGLWDVSYMKFKTLIGSN